MFKKVSDITDALAGQQYIATDEISTAVFLAEKMGKPILAEGPAGVGKTELAKAWAGATGRELIRLQCYEGLDESKALYEWEYSKQMLYTQLLRDKISQVMSSAETLSERGEGLHEREPSPPRRKERRAHASIPSLPRYRNSIGPPWRTGRDRSARPVVYGPIF